MYTTPTMAEMLTRLAGMDETVREDLANQIGNLLDAPVDDFEKQQEELVEVFAQWRQVDANIQGIRKVLEVGGR